MSFQVFAEFLFRQTAHFFHLFLVVQLLVCRMAAACKRQYACAFIRIVCNRFEMSATSGYACLSCGHFVKSLSDVLRHVRLLHFGTPGFTTLKCNLEGCNRSFKKYAVFRNHIYEYHSNKIETGGAPVATETGSLENYSSVNEDSDEDGTEDAIYQVTPANCMQRAAAIWVQEVRRLPQSTTDGIMQDFGCLYDAALSNDVSEVLRKSGVDNSIILQLAPIFSPNGPHSNLFSGLETNYKQIQYYKKQFHFVVSHSSLCKQL